MLVNIKKPIIEIEGKKTILKSEILFDNKTRTIFYETDSDYQDFFDDENITCFLIAILPYCMMKAKQLGRKIVIKGEGRVSKILKFQLQKYLIPILAHNISYYSDNVEINIIGEELYYSDANAIATGVSGGVDSSYSIFKNIRNEDYPLTHVLLGNLGIYKGYDSKVERVLEEHCENIANAVNLPLIKMRTNACIELYKKAYAPIVPFVFVSMVFSLPKLFKVYLFSSAFAANDFHFSEDDAAYYEIFTLSQLRTESISFYSSGSETTRLEKLRYIGEEKCIQDNLQVCLSVTENGENCNRCAKCSRTMAELETLGILDKFSRVFDIEEFKNNQGYHWGYVLLKSWEKDPFYVELINSKIKMWGGITPKIWIEALKKWKNRGFSTVNNKKENVWENID